jgi:quinol monooxygenase YgiN
MPQLQCLPGCRGPCLFALVEAYVDEDAFQAHRASAHFEDNITRTLAPLLLERSWRRYGPLL